MKKYAIIKIGGKQVKVTEGESFSIERQEKLNFDVLAYSDGKDILIGTPIVKGVKVDAKITGEERADKIRVGRFKSKSRYRKVKGHKQPMSIIEVKKITKGAEKTPTAVKATKTEKIEKKVVKKAAPAKKVSKEVAEKKDSKK